MRFALKAGSSSALVAVFLTMGGCATQQAPVETKQAPQTPTEQKSAQASTLAQATATPMLKRKVALGRLSNETAYGQSLLRDKDGDPLGKQVTDLFSKALTESGAYLVFERPDISKVQAESQLAQQKLDLIGVDALIVGSLSEFGRKTVGSSGFASSSKKQVAFAKIDIRLVDTRTGHVFFATSGAGEASNEVSSTFGFGSRAGYDGTLNDAAIRQAVSEAVSKLSTEMNRRPWSTAILKAEGGRIFISGGKSQGLQPGMTLAVQTAGEQIKSPQTGALITLPGQRIAQLRVDALFGDSELNEGAVTSVVSGDLGKHPVSSLVVLHEGGK
ncbi:hypothetical protein GCM10027276_41070 [Comamonas piscis]